MTNYDYQIAKLKKRIAFLEEALAWYADPGNYSIDDWNVLSVIQSPDYGNPGFIARVALSDNRREVRKLIKESSQ